MRPLSSLQFYSLPAVFREHSTKPKLSCVCVLITIRVANYPGKPAKIAFAGFDGNDQEIYTINASGGGKKQLTDNSTPDEYPYYSPSGKRIAYVNDAGTDEDIWTIQPSGGGRQQVTDNGGLDRDPYWGSQ